MYRASLGDELPYANRTGALIAGPEALPVGIMTVFNAEGFIYTYTNSTLKFTIVDPSIQESKRSELFRESFEACFPNKKAFQLFDSFLNSQSYRANI